MWVVSVSVSVSVSVDGGWWVRMPHAVLRMLRMVHTVVRMLHG